MRARSGTPLATGLGRRTEDQLGQKSHEMSIDHFVPAPTTAASVAKLPTATIRRSTFVRIMYPPLLLELTRSQRVITIRSACHDHVMTIGIQAISLGD
jgi:hypothetical protein